jgi:hypothetical protein
MKKKEALEQVRSLSIRKQLGKTFDHERLISKRIKEETEFEKLNKATHS